MIAIVMGVSGCGKSSVGQAIAELTGWTYIEGDALHPESNRRKMASGTPLDDDDRWPWLDAIANEAAKCEATGNNAVVACSALKRAYRERLNRAGPSVCFIYLRGDRDVIADRMLARRDHFMPPGLLKSQLATLEPPGSEEAAIAYDITAPVDEIARQAVAWAKAAPTAHDR